MTELLVLAEDHEKTTWKCSCAARVRTLREHRIPASGNVTELLVLAEDHEKTTWKCSCAAHVWTLREHLVPASGLWKAVWLSLWSLPRTMGNKCDKKLTAALLFQQ